MKRKDEETEVIGRGSGRVGLVSRGERHLYTRDHSEASSLLHDSQDMDGDKGLPPVKIPYYIYHEELKDNMLRVIGRITHLCTQVASVQRVVWGSYLKPPLYFRLKSWKPFVTLLRLGRILILALPARADLTFEELRLRPRYDTEQQQCTTNMPSVPEPPASLGRQSLPLKHQQCVSLVAGLFPTRAAKECKFRVVVENARAIDAVQ
ncbi:hypothetical protein J6590_028331 [Homalodisca vitripennis]|nr:hypothetical protein J6590_028331 [Homalodisca vitripennis]